MDFLLDPNVAYILLVGGLLMAVLALLSPGTGLLEIGALFMLILAGFSIANFTINWWALVILVVGVFPFLLALRRSRQYGYLIIALAALVIGSVFLVTGRDGSPAVNPFLAIIVSGLVVGFLWLAGRKTLEALAIPTKEMTDVVGKLGEAHTDIFTEGSVYVNGEEWTGRSATLIPAGNEVRVLAREGLVLFVEPINAD